jgi:hypothetical protein
MVAIQVLEAEREMSRFAIDFMQKQPWIKKDFRLFAYLFDTRVLNGSMKGVVFRPAIDGDTSVVQYACEAARQKKPTAFRKRYNLGDGLKNCDLWLSKRANGLTMYQCSMLYSAYERASLSRFEFFHTTWCRRGTLAVGAGWVNETLRFPYKEVGADPDELLVVSNESTTKVSKVLGEVISDLLNENGAAVYATKVSLNEPK